MLTHTYTHKLLRKVKVAKNHQADDLIYVWPTVWSCNFCEFKVYGGRYNVEYHYWDQALLNNTKFDFVLQRDEPNNPGVWADVWEHAVQRGTPHRILWVPSKVQAVLTHFMQKHFSVYITEFLQPGRFENLAKSRRKVRVLFLLHCYFDYPCHIPLNHQQN